MAEHQILRGKVTAYPDGEDQGLVEVALGALDTQGNTVYARMGQGIPGLYWLPEIGDVVEVDLSDAPGYEARIVHIHRTADDAQRAACWDAENQKKQCKTRSGHTITLDDTADQGSLVVQTAGGLSIRLEDASETITLCGKEDTPRLCLDGKQDEIRLEAGKKLTLACGGASLTFDSSGNITIKTSAKLTLQGQEVALEAQSKLSGKGQQTELTGGMQTKVSGQGKLELSANGIVEVKGGLINLN